MWIDDQVLARHAEPLVAVAFVPDQTLVVLGSSNNAATEVDLTRCLEAGIPVTRRYGGGGTVVLYPGCVVVTVGVWVKDPYQNSRYFKTLNQAVIDCLSDMWPETAELSQSGISDIVWKDKKIGGTSLFRSRHYLLYQASLLVDLDLKLIERCLKHPTKEPDYRQGRRHESFLSCLGQITKVTPQDICLQLENNVASFVRKNLADELILPQENEMKSLQERLTRAERLPAV